MVFRFKQFSVEDDHSTMRIGTDAILLGAWAAPMGTGELIIRMNNNEFTEHYLTLTGSFYFLLR